MKRIAILSAVILLAVSAAAFAGGSDMEKIEAARGVLGRVIPDRAAEFQLEVIPQENGLDVFEIESAADGAPVIRGSSVTAILSGVNWFLKYYCNAHVSWTGDQLNLPSPLPRVENKIRINTPYKYRYIYNYCTFNYTMSFWDWDRWQRELDFLALNGVNIVLAMTGQEKLWQNYMRRMGFDEKEISDFIVGPAFEAWWLMGNIEGWGGPVSQAWIDHQYELQKQILARMDELEMEPVLQGFYGMFPRAGIKRFPEARIYETGDWAYFKRPAIVDPTDPFFKGAAAAWYEEQRKLYGDRKYYGGDPFHEGGGADINLTDAGREIQDAMLAAEPGSTWVIQAWQDNPKKEMLDGTKKENTLILELFAESSPQWVRREGFYGHPWVWCIISNFGGKASLYGAMNKVAKDPPYALASPDKGNLQGIGAIMEASEMDPPLWDLLYEMAWRMEAPDLADWITKYARRRYGKENFPVAEAWKKIRNTAYEVDLRGGGTPVSPFCARPDLKIKSARVWGTMQRDYDPCELADAWKIFVDNAEEFRGVDTFEHDIVDVTRQVVADFAVNYLARAEAAWDAKDAAAFKAAGDKFLEILLDQDKLMATDRMFTLGRWVEMARALGSTPEEKDQFEWNAKVQITTWGPREPAQGLRDYSHREWADLLGGFYYQRWKMFFDKLQPMLENPEKYLKEKEKKKSGKDMWNTAMSEIRGESPRNDPSGIDWYAWEENWAKQTGGYRAAPEGDRINEAKRIYEKYYPVIKEGCTGKL